MSVKKAETERIVFLTCSGASNSGQIANRVAIKLTEEGLGNLCCLAGIGAHIEAMIKHVKSADKIVVLDGCPTACARKLTEHLGIHVSDHIRITDLGIKKVHNFAIKADEIMLVADHAKKILGK